jgi:hypothetical protein
MKLSIKNAKVAIEGDIELDMPDTLLESDKVKAEELSNVLHAVVGQAVPLLHKIIDTEREERAQMYAARKTEVPFNAAAAKKKLAAKKK